MSEHTLEIRSQFCSLSHGSIRFFCSSIPFHCFSLLHRPSPSSTNSFFFLFFLSFPSSPLPTPRSLFLTLLQRHLRIALSPNWRQLTWRREREEGVGKEGEEEEGEKKRCENKCRRMTEREQKLCVCVLSTTLKRLRLVTCSSLSLSLSSLSVWSFPPSGFLSYRRISTFLRLPSPSPDMPHKKIKWMEDLCFGCRMQFLSSASFCHFAPFLLPPPRFIPHPPSHFCSSAVFLSSSFFPSFFLSSFCCLSNYPASLVIQPTKGILKSFLPHDCLHHTEPFSHPLSFPTHSGKQRHTVLHAACCSRHREAMPTEWTAGGKNEQAIRV